MGSERSESQSELKAAEACGAVVLVVVVFGRRSCAVRCAALRFVALRFEIRIPNFFSLFIYFFL